MVKTKRQDVADDSLRARLLPIVQSLKLKSGWSVDEAVAAASELTGRRILLLPLKPGNTMHAAKVCGYATRAVDYDIVWYRPPSDPARRLQTVGHELGHLILGHKPDYKETDASGEVDFHALANALTGMDIPRSAYLGARGFSDYDSPNEYEAELFGSLLVTNPSRSRVNDSSRPSMFQLF